MLTDKAVRAAKALDKPQKLSDRNGLFLHISVKGHKSWRYKYRIQGKEQLIVLGTYPDVSLAEAREKRDASCKLLREGRDPRHSSIRSKLIGPEVGQKTFEVLAREWHALHTPRWKPVHANDVITSLKRDIFPHIGILPLSEIDEPLLLSVLRKVEGRGAIETARRLKQRVNSVFLYGRSLGIKVDNPAATIGASLKPIPPAKRYPALVEIEAIRKMMHEIDRAGASPVTRLAARFLALTCQRPGMVRNMRWGHIEGIDWGTSERLSPEAIWIIPAANIKQELHLREDEAFEQKVPLTSQAVETLRAVRWLTGRAPYVFPNSLSGIKPMSENAIGYLYNREGFRGKQVPHGWRSSFSTIMNEQAERELGQDTRLLGDRMIIDLMLAHTPTGMSASELRYNRSAYMPRRRELAERWAALIMEGALPASEIIGSARRKPRS